MFNSKYTDYWINAVEKSIDGTIIPGLGHARNFLSSIPNMSSDATILDIGCSFGRMFEALHELSENIHGLDVENSALEKAAKFSYKSLRNCSAEKTGFENEFADLIFTWLVFDVLNQKNFLKEACRVLKTEGVLFFTGCSNNYLDDDDLAFNAEKNSYLKGFPKRFTDVPILIDYLKLIGFSTVKLFLFERRGDFGKLRYNSIVDSDIAKNKFYEFIYIGVKSHDDLSNTQKSVEFEFSNIHSLTAHRISNNSGFVNVSKFFEALSAEK